jgi:hypothetical protein
MTKLAEKHKTLKPYNSSTILDTLVQLRTDTSSQVVTKPKTDVKKYQSRAKAKGVSNAITFRLVDIDSPLNKYYWRAFHCNNILEQRGQTLIGSYCNTRHCLVCNRIRTAKAINGYKKPLEQIGRKCFITLTRQSVKGKDLNKVITQMNSNFRNNLKNLKKTYGITLKGIRKFECNYNPKEDTFNPHFHLVAGGTACEMLLLKSLWLNQYNAEVATVKAQDIRVAKDGSEIELFKYMTKMITSNGNIYPKALDTIFIAIKGKRTVQPFGGIKKVSEDVDGIKKEDVDFITCGDTVWQWCDIHLDWISEYGEVLTNYKPDRITIELINKITTQ